MTNRSKKDKKINNISHNAEKNNSEATSSNEKLVETLFELQKVKENYQKLFNFMNEAVVIGKIVYDTAGKPYTTKWVEFNSSFEKLLGITHKAEVFSENHSINIEELKSPFFNIILNVVRTGETAFFETNINEKDLEVTVFSHDIDQYIAVINDISERKKLEKINISLQEANLQKNQFLTNLSPKLRTPLHAIIGFSEILEKEYFGELNEKQMEYVTLITNSGQHILSLMNDIIDIIKIDSGSMEFKLEEFSTESFFDETITLIKEELDNHDVSIGYNINPVASVLHGDKSKCLQILNNILANSLKYIPEGGNIEINAEKLTDNKIQISVIDNGIGYDDYELDNLFPEFHQLDEESLSNLGGKGVDLTLVKRLIEMHDGEIGVVSNLGKGTTYWFTLPIKS